MKAVMAKLSEDSYTKGFAAGRIRGCEQFLDELHEAEDKIKKLEKLLEEKEIK
jgi:hypothetical protein